MRKSRERIHPLTFRRYYLDQLLKSTRFTGKILDVGGKKKGKRGQFNPPHEGVEIWMYLNVDERTEPDYQCSAERIPLPDNYLDMVLMTEVLEHLENPCQVMKECYRILKLGGKLIATMPFLFPIHGDPFDFQRWTPERIRMVLHEFNFRCEALKPMGSIFAVIYDLLHVSLGIASRNRHSVYVRITNRFIMPTVSRIFLFLDRKCAYQSKWITSGYYIAAIKCKTKGSAYLEELKEF